MNILVVDADQSVLESNEQAIFEAAPQASVVACGSSENALEYAHKKQVDVAFLGIDLPKTNGLGLAKQLKKENPQVNIIFVTNHNSYANEAFSLRASGYVIKPLTAERVALEMAHLRNPVADKRKDVRIQCFGNFEVFVGGVPLVFNRPKSKEILAYLVDRNGASITKKDLARILWPGEDYTRSIQSHLHILITDLLKILADAGADDVIIKQRNTLALNVARVDCDYFNYEKGNAGPADAYRGEYMTNYPWARTTRKALDSTRELAKEQAL